MELYPLLGIDCSCCQCPYPGVSLHQNQTVYMKGCLYFELLWKLPSSPMLCIWCETHSSTYCPGQLNNTGLTESLFTVVPLRSWFFNRSEKKQEQRDRFGLMYKLIYWRMWKTIANCQIGSEGPCSSAISTTSFCCLRMIFYELLPNIDFRYLRLPKLPLQMRTIFLLYLNQGCSIFQCPRWNSWFLQSSYFLHILYPLWENQSTTNCNREETEIEKLNQKEIRHVFEYFLLKRHS